MKTIAVVLAFVAVVLGARVAKETDVSSNAFPPHGWEIVEAAAPTDRITLTFAVKQSNTHELLETLMRVSDPTSKDYGKHLTLEQVDALTAPSAEARQTVRGFLANHGVESDKIEAHSHDDMIRFSVSVEVAERMLGAKYFIAKHSKTGITAVRTAGYSLPAEVAAHVDFVGPTVRFPAIRLPKQELSLAGANTPDSLRALYNVGTVEGKSSKNLQAASAFLEQYMSASDLQTFYKDYYPVAVGRTVTIIGPNNRPTGVEAQLDIEYITALGGNVPTQFLSFAGRAPDNNANEPFLDMLYYLGNQTNPPVVVSTSYGEDETSVSLDYANRCNEEFQEQGARGISLLFASGDSGVASDNGQCTRFVAQWPSGSPYVTAVGGTTGTNPESGAGLSSGGFSDRWAQPSWQKQAVATFFATSTSLPDSSRYNASGRGFPDVAAQATNFDVVIDGTLLPGVAGTSCASPTFSGVVALLNDLRYQAGKGPLGFLNPLIYSSLYTGLNDIKSGDNPGCGTKGFTAIAGWDPVTGYGTPNYAALAQLVTSLP